MKHASLGCVVALAAIFIFESSTFGIIRRHDRDDAKYLSLGAKYPACTRVGGGCGTLIGPQWILTAGHVANNLSPFQRTIAFNGKKYSIDAIDTHPDWKRKSGAASMDIALLHLATPVEGVKPIDIYTKKDEVGREMVFAGIGMYGDGQRGPVGDDGKLRGATNTVAGEMENWITFKFDAPPDGTDLEGISGPGDSGGPAIIEVDGKMYVIGVSSANDDKGADGPCRYNSTEYYARVSTAAEWIQRTMKEGPPQPQPPAPKIVDLKTAKLPDSRAGKIATAFFEAYAAGDDASLSRFEQTYRAKSALEKKPIDKRLESWRQFHREWGKLKPAKYAEADGNLIILLHAETEDVWKTFKFELEPEAPNQLIGIDIASPVTAPD
jgi:hypothetical protein